MVDGRCSSFLIDIVIVRYRSLSLSYDNDNESIMTFSVSIANSFDNMGTNQEFSS